MVCQTHIFAMLAGWIQYSDNRLGGAIFDPDTTLVKGTLPCIVQQPIHASRCMCTDIIDDEDYVSAPEPVTIVAGKPPSHWPCCVAIGILQSMAINQAMHLARKLAAISNIVIWLSRTIKQNHVVCPALPVIGRVFGAIIKTCS